MPLRTSTGTEGGADVGGSASPRPFAIVITLAVFVVGIILIAWSLVGLSKARLHAHATMGIGIGLVLAVIVVLIEYVKYNRVVR